MSEMASVERRFQEACCQPLHLESHSLEERLALGVKGGEFVSARATQRQDGLLWRLTCSPGVPCGGRPAGGKGGEVSVLQGTEKETILVLRSCHFTQNKCHRSYKCESFILIDFSVIQKLLPIKDAKQKNTFSRKKVISSIGRTYTWKLVKDSRVSSESIKRFAILENTVEASRNS